MPQLCRYFSVLFLMVFTVGLGFCSPAFADIPFPVTMSENITVTGSPRLVLDIGGVTRYAPYSSGSGTSVLTFSYPVVAGDFDRDGITITSPIDLNGGTLTDLAGNAPSSLAFVPPNTSAVFVQAYQPVLTTTPVDDSNKTAVAFNITGAPTSGATYNYSFTSSGGGGSVTGSGAITADPQSVSGINVSALPSGTLTLSLTVTAASGTGNAKTTTAAYTNSFTGALDSLPASASAYSIRRLRTAYTGPLIRVRRSSDSTEQDISYEGDGDLDTTALTTFCGVNSCYVSVWYDQSGNARTATQTTAAYQPRIVNSGTLETLNSRIGLVWDGAGDYLRQADGALGGLANITIVTTFRMNNNKTMQLFDIRNHLDSTPVFDDDNQDGFAVRRRDDSGTLVGSSDAPKDTVAHVASFTYDGSNISHFLDAATTDTVASPGTTSGSFFIMLGNNGAVPLTDNFEGTISEFVYFSSNLGTSDRQALETSQKAYFGTP